MDLVCPKCKKKSAYYRVSTKEWRCRKCGAVWEDKSVKKEKPLPKKKVLKKEKLKKKVKVLKEGKEEKVVRTEAEEKMVEELKGEPLVLKEEEKTIKPEVFLSMDLQEEEKMKILHQRAIRLSQIEEEEKEEKVNVVILILNDEWYGIPVENVREILKRGEITRVPCAPPEVIGIINLRGEIISIIDLKKVLGLELTSSALGSQIIIVQVSDLKFGLLVDFVSDLVGVNIKSLESPLPTIEKAKAEYIYGEIIIDKRLVGILNVEKISVASEIFREAKASQY